MTGTGAKKLSQIRWSTSSTGYPRIDTRIDMKTTQGEPVLLPSIIIIISYRILIITRGKRVPVPWYRYLEVPVPDYRYY